MNANSTESFNELIFENRNKEYGAYVLRRSYNDNMTKSMFLALGFFGLLTLAGIFYSDRKGPDTKGILLTDSLVSVTVTTLPPDIYTPPADPSVKPPSSPKGSDYTNLTVVDHHTDDPNSNTPPLDPGDPKGVDTAATTGHGTFVVKLPDPIPSGPPEPPTTIADEMPDFKGGITQYVSANVVYPRAAVEEMKGGTVYLTFVVETDGSVSNVKVLKGIGLGCEEEAMRVIKSMPKWKPGKNKGVPVRVQFNLPVRFTIK